MDVESKIKAAMGVVEEQPVTFGTVDDAWPDVSLIQDPWVKDLCRQRGRGGWKKRAWAARLAHMADVAADPDHARIFREAAKLLGWVV